MDTARYYIALLLVLFVPGAFLVWFSIHPFVGFWRKVGPQLTLAIHYCLILILAACIFLVRKPLLSIEFGTNPVLILLAVPLYVLAIVLRLQLAKQLKPGILMGLPELAPEKYHSRLLTEGIYSRIRHPRYVQMLLASMALAMASNYLAAYAVFLAGVVWIFLVTRIEERELRERFGAEYEAYCAQVPRFVPKL